MYNHTGLQPKHTARSYASVIWNSAKWNETRRIGAIFACFRVGLSASAGLSCSLCQSFQQSSVLWLSQDALHRVSCTHEGIFLACLENMWVTCTFGLVLYSLWNMQPVETSKHVHDTANRALKVKDQLQCSIQDWLQSSCVGWPSYFCHDPVTLLLSYATTHYVWLSVSQRHKSTMFDPVLLNVPW